MPTELMSLREALDTHGIEINEAEEKVCHCGDPMRVYEGCIGPDLLHCERCGLMVGNLASPHINGGCFMSEEWIKERAERVWGKVSPA